MININLVKKILFFIIIYVKLNKHTLNPVNTNRLKIYNEVFLKYKVSLIYHAL